jgi:hypothetical protein
MGINPFSIYVIRGDGMSREMGLYIRPTVLDSSTNRKWLVTCCNPCYTLLSKIASYI